MILEYHFSVILALFAYILVSITSVFASENLLDRETISVSVVDAEISEIVKTINSKSDIQFELAGAYEINNKFTFKVNKAGIYTTVKYLLKSYDYYLLTDGKTLTAYVLGPSDKLENQASNEIYTSVVRSSINIEALESPLQNNVNQSIPFTEYNNKYNYAYTDNSILEKIQVTEKVKDEEVNKYYSYGLTNDGIPESIPAQNENNRNVNYYYDLTYDGIIESIPVQNTVKTLNYTYGRTFDGISEVIPDQE